MDIDTHLGEWTFKGSFVKWIFHLTKEPLKEMLVFNKFLKLELRYDHVLIYSEFQKQYFDF